MPDLPAVAPFFAGLEKDELVKSRKTGQIWRLRKKSAGKARES
jgi:hypothetical protein